MPTISIRVSDEIKSRLDDLAQESEVTLSSVILDAINTAIGGVRADYPSDMAPYALSSTNRLILCNQELLLSMSEKLDKYDREAHAKNAEILKLGFTSEYSTVFSPLFPEVPYSLCEELYGILDMFRILRFSYDNLSSKEKKQVDEEDISFRGFDYNDSVESQLSCYVEFLLKDNKYEELKEPLERYSDGGNSHHCNLEVYRRMHRCFTPIWRQHLIGNPYLNLEEIKKVVSAIPYNSGY